MTLQSAVMDIGFGASTSQCSDHYGSETGHRRSTQLMPFGIYGDVNILEEDRRTRQAQVERTGVRIRWVSPNALLRYDSTSRWKRLQLYRFTPWRETLES